MNLGMTSSPESGATRYAASLLTKYVIDLVHFAVHRYDLSIEELAIIALVFTESTRPIREDFALAAQYGLEAQGLPNKQRPAVSLKFVHTKLGMSRETTRRKLERLVNQGFITRLGNSYVFAHPESQQDFTRDLRLYLQAQLKAIVAEADSLENAININNDSCNRVERNQD